MAASDGLKDYTKEKGQIEGPECSSQNSGEISKFSVSFKRVLIYLRLRANKAEDQLQNLI